MRGRGLARLINGISEGDPASIGIAVLLGVILVAWVAYKIKTGPRV